MANDEVRRMALRMLADDDAGNLGRSFSGPFELSVPQAYDLQSEVARLREQRGEKLIGYKIGCVGRAVQEQLGIDEPIFGRLFDTGCVRSGARLSHARYANLAVEGELAIRLALDVPVPRANDGIDPAVVGSVFPVIELHQYVLGTAAPSCAALVASNGMHAGFVHADHETPCSDLPNGVQYLSVRINDAEVGRVTDPWTLGSPHAALHWLAARLEAHRLQLLRGQVILTGSPLRLFPVRPSTRIMVEAPPCGTSRAEIDP